MKVPSARSTYFQVLRSAGWKDLCEHRPHHPVGLIEALRC